MELSDYEKRVLAETPEKAIAFLRAAATKVEIRAALFAVGYTPEEQANGWALLHKASGHAPEVESASDDQVARAALSEIDAWDEPGFRRISAALKRLHPQQHEFVFAGLEASRGAGSVLGVATLLERLSALKDSPERQATRQEDHAALATLAARGFKEEEFAHLRQLLALAQAAVTPLIPTTETVEQHQEALKELRAWYKDWSETARAVIHRKDYLVMLGLSRRKTRKTDAGETETDSTELENDAPTNSNPVIGGAAASPTLV